MITRAAQKVRFRIFGLFFRQHWNKLPRGECSGDFYDHTVKIWRLVCFSSCFSQVKVELLVAGATNFEMRVVIRYLHAEGQLADLQSHFSVFSPLKSTSDVSQRLKKQFNPIHTQRRAPYFEFSVTSSIEFQYLVDLQHVKNVLPHTSQICWRQLLATALLLDWSMMRNIHWVFKFLQCNRTNLLNILPLVVYFSVA